MPADFILIANPTSGHQRAPHVATRVTEILKAKGASAELRLTAARGDAQRIAAEAASQGARVIVGCGGDGTLQEIAMALEGGSAAMGVVPSGRCNDFAAAIGLSRHDSPERLADVLLNGTKRAIDIGAMGSARFLTVATLGFDSEVSRFVETRKLWLKGTPAYLYALMRVLIGFQGPLVKLKGDFGEFEGRVLLAATGNTACYGGAMQIVPGALLDDGLFNMCVVDNVSRTTVLRVLPRVMKGTHLTHPAVRSMHTRSVEIETPGQRVWVCADGESLGQTPCRFDIKPGALQVMCPAGSQSKV